MFQFHFQRDTRDTHLLSDEELQMWCLERLHPITEAELATLHAQYLFEYVREVSKDVQITAQALNDRTHVWPISTPVKIPCEEINGINERVEKPFKPVHSL
ncbi:MAG: hypothetical protein LBK53_01515 [Heliobacteriaceae bacterium]|jgi:hypothetical protein|nr:hypothetical protein [Heliobacteriaceae bacterium]